MPSVRGARPRDARAGKSRGPSARAIVAKLRSMGDPAAVAGMARYGIRPSNVFGVTMPALRAMARTIGRDHALAAELWATGNREARIVAALIDDPAQVTEAQMDAWAGDFASWDVCDGCCSSLFDRTPFAFDKALAWSRRDEEYVKRAGFVLMATLAVHDKRADDARFIRFFPRIRAEAKDGRNFVKKAVNWALRQIGKRNLALHARAIEEAHAVAAIDAPSARWIAADALRELTSDAVRERLEARASRDAREEKPRVARAPATRVAVTKSSGGSPSRTSPKRAPR